MRLTEGLGPRPYPRPKLVAYFMVDRARRRSYARLAAAARSAGADALELGFPFSDPIADGPVLQAAADRALRHGTTWTDLRRAVRSTRSHLPTAVMTYANPLWRRGLDRAMEELARDGAGGVIVPDLSLEETGPWRRAAERTGLDLVLLAAPGADRRRMRRLSRSSRGFLYLVSRYGTTGPAGGMASGLSAMVRTAHAAAPRLPVFIGFGIHDATSARRAIATHADGAVVASALEEALHGGSTPAVVRQVLTAIRRALSKGSR